MRKFVLFLCTTAFCAPWLAAADENGALCNPATELCLDATGRFVATATYQGPGGTVPAILVPPAGGRRGYFTTGDRRFAEMAAEVVNGCALNGQFWVRILGISDRGMAVTATDLQTGAQRSYEVPPGVTGPSILDSQGFACEPPPVWLRSEPERTPTTVQGGAALRLANGRFEINGQVVSEIATGLILTDYSGGLVYLVTQHSLVKIVPNHSTGFYEFSAASSAESTITVNDTCLTQQKTYPILSGGTVYDPVAFPVDAATCGLFADGFESGTTTAWQVATH